MLHPTALTDFIAKHGGQPMRSNGETLLPDGAKYSGSDLVLFFEPPITPVENAKARELYWETAVAFEQAAFDQYKNDCDRQDEAYIRSPYGFPPTNEFHLDQLRQGKARLEKFKASLAEVWEELKELKVPTIEDRRLAQQQQDAQRRAHTQADQDAARERIAQRAAI